MKKIIPQLALVTIALLANLSLLGQTVENLVGKGAYDFSLKKYKTHETFKLDQSDRSKIIVIEFWATWCGPCIQAMPHLNELAAQFSDAPVEFMSVTYEEDEERIARFLEKHELNTKIMIDPGFAMFKKYSAWAIPQTLIINKDRIVVANIHPTKLTAKIIQDVIGGKPLAIEGNGERTYFEPSGAERFFKSQSGIKD